MDGDRQSARDALRAVQVTLADGLARLWVASSVRGGGAPPEEGESFVTAWAGGGTTLLPSGASLRGQLSQFLPRGLGFSGVAREGGSSGERTILPSDHGSVGPSRPGRGATAASWDEGVSWVARRRVGGGADGGACLLAR